MTLLDSVPMSDDLLKKPFVPTDGFDSTWWVGFAKGPAIWGSVADAALGEVARVQIKLQSSTGAAYPTRNVPADGATEIDLLEVRADLRGDGLGRKVVALIEDRFPDPYVALSLNSDSDGFWRSLRWHQYENEDAAGARADGATIPALLFASSG